jgi:hypothetical protein
MKKWLKHLLIILGVIIGFIIVCISSDIVNAKIFRKSPIISWHEYLGDYGYVDRGLVFDVFYCNQSSDVVFVSWKLKGSKYTCPEVKYEPMISRIGNVFVKTYNVERIKKIDDDYQYWTVSQFEGESAEIVKVNTLSKKIEVGKKYEITFRIKSDNIEDNIKSIFENADIEFIKETDQDINQFIR